jgi:hypothetical protein
MRISILLAAALIAAALTTGTAIAQQSPSDTGNAGNGPIAILKNMIPEPGGVDVQINGREVGRLQTASYDDITGAVHAGSNTLIVTWNGPVQQLDFEVAYAPTRNNFRNVLVVKTGADQDPALRQRGSQTFAFTIPN